MNFLSVYIYFIALSLLASILTHRKSNPVYLKWLIPFLFVTLAIEVFNSYLASQDRNNLVFYNFFSVFEFVFYLFLLGRIVRSRTMKQVIHASAVLYTLGAVFNIVFIQGIHVFHTTSYAAGCLMLVAFCIYYFYEVFRMPARGNLVENPAFWICTALLFFYCCGFPLYGLVNYWSRSWELMRNSFTMLTNLLNIFFYSLFTIAFLCNRNRNYTLSSS